MSRSRSVAAGVTGLLAATMVAILGAAADPADAAVVCGTGGAFTTSPPTCTYTKVGTDTFTVPDGVTGVSFDLLGAEGGSAPGFIAPNPTNGGAPGGLGGETRATMAVSPGQVLQITVGTAGINGSSQKGMPALAGGFGHGTGGFGGHGGAGSGGGGTDVRVGAAGATDRVLVAGGGGGPATVGRCCTVETVVVWSGKPVVKAGARLDLASLAAAPPKPRTELEAPIRPVPGPWGPRRSVLRSHDRRTEPR